ncbi:hypothetical protein [Streptomyces sp. JJ36]|uniref:hypothetical protein n=1 Tax=Streptomyces sp. JJ36 TaxID=2736645 RepID=UPI001F1636EA|nr:hypothetical protein [Streptomyces sp. JJ36]MCF6524898.1 hypothetical protein [Streptomyces sp. JJ36]
MVRRGEPVPYTFVAEAERFRSDVTPPPRPRRSPRQIAGGVLLALTVISGLVGSLLLGVPALDAERHRDGDPPAARNGR